MRRLPDELHPDADVGSSAERAHETDTEELFGDDIVGAETLAVFQVHAAVENDLAELLRRRLEHNPRFHPDRGVENLLEVFAVHQA